jgi:hypothetical protein
MSWLDDTDDDEQDKYADYEARTRPNPKGNRARTKTRPDHSDAVTGRVLTVHEDSRTGGIGESLAAIIQEEAFEWLDAPIRVIGALDTPVPYSPPPLQGLYISESGGRCLFGSAPERAVSDTVRRVAVSQTTGGCCLDGVPAPNCRLLMCATI